MQTVADLNSPRHQLPFDKLPRGFVPFPEPIVQGVADLAAKSSMAMASNTLVTASFGTR
jgi:hypothetical protein